MGGQVLSRCGGSKLISIVLPSHNGSRFLAAAIESCQRQSYRNWELILVDDGSTDDTPLIIASSTAVDGRLRAVYKRERQGLPAALNAGFAMADGEYLTWTSDDNLYAPRALETMAGFLDRHSEISFVNCSQWVIDDQGAILRLEEAGTFDQLHEANGIGGCFLYRREVYEKIGPFADDMFLVEDYDYWFRVRESFSVGRMPEVAPYLYRVHGESLSSRRWLKVQRQIARVKYRHLGLTGSRREFMASAYCDIAARAGERGRWWWAMVVGAIAVVRYGGFSEMASRLLRRLRANPIPRETLTASSAWRL